MEAVNKWYCYIEYSGRRPLSRHSPSSPQTEAPEQQIAIVIWIFTRNEQSKWYLLVNFC